MIRVALPPHDFFRLTGNGRLRHHGRYCPKEKK
jgi:hypothetical protein